MSGGAATLRSSEYRKPSKSIFRHRSRNILTIINNTKPNFEARKRLQRDVDAYMSRILAEDKDESNRSGK